MGFSEYVATGTKGKKTTTLLKQRNQMRAEAKRNSQQRNQGLNESSGKAIIKSLSSSMVVPSADKKFITKLQQSA